MKHETSKMLVLRIRERRVNLLLLAQGRSRGLLLHSDFRDRAVAIRAKAKVIIPKWETLWGSRPDKAGDMFPLPSTWTLEAGLSLEAGIPELWDTSISVISGTYTDTVFSSLPHHGPGETVSVVWRCIGPYYYEVRPDGLG